MIEPGVNGRLVPCTRTDRDITAFADTLVDVLTAGTFDDLRRQSARKTEAYRPAAVRRRWAHLLHEETRC